MATPAERYGEGLNITFDYDDAAVPAIGDRVEITSNRKVRPITQIGSPNEIGVCIDVRNALMECTVMTDFTYNRQDRVAGEAVVAGPCVFGPGNKVYQYVPATRARHDGTTTGPKTVVVDTDDTIKVAIGGGSPQTIVITAGVGLTFAAIAEEVNATLTDAHLEVDVAGHMNVVCDDIFKSVEVATVATDAYTLLGWTEAVYTPTAPNYDPSLCESMVVVGGAKDALVETLEE